MADNIYLNIAQDKGLIAQDDWEGWRLTKKGERMLSALMRRGNGIPGIAENGDFPISEVLESEPEVFRWEYTVTSLRALDATGDQALTAWLDHWGNDGWELILLGPLRDYCHRAIFKRKRIE